MKLLKTLIPKGASPGFTFIEIIIAMGLMATLIGLGLALSMDVWRGTSFSSEQDLVVTLLYKARSSAVTNVHESDHGLYIDEANRQYVIFEGSSYDSNDPDNIPFEMSPNITFTGDNEIVFSAREARTSGPTVTLEGESRTKTLSINQEGGITW